MNSQFTTVPAVLQSILFCGLLLGLTACSTTPLASVSAPLPVQAQPATANPPFLRLETGMHTAQIMRIAVDKTERFLVTASLDKTARVWDLKTGKLLQVLRPPIGEGDEGKLYAVAMSPEGKEVAVGGYTGSGTNDIHIYFFDRATGRLTRRITQLPNIINHLAYSKDGNRLGVILAENGIRVYDTTILKEIGKDSDYGYDNYWLDFANDGRLVSSSSDGYIRLYDAQLRLVQKAKAPGGQQPFAARFSPDGEKIAVGFNDSTAVNVLSAHDLHLLYAPDTQGIDNGDLSKVAWSQDGLSLYAAGRYVISGKTPVFSWSKAGQGQRVSMPLAGNAIMDLFPLHNQQLAFGAGDPAWGVIDKVGNKLIAQGSALYDFRDNPLSINSTATLLYFKERWGNEASFTFDFQQQTFSQAKAANALSAAKTSASGLNIASWKNTTNPTLNGAPLPLQPYETSRALAISPDEQHFVLGTNWSLRYYNHQGQEQWQTPTPETTWAVNLSADGRFAVAAFGDGTIRWYNTTDGKEQLAFFPHANGKDWVLWTPEGFFNASDKGKDLIGYHLNQGADHEGQFVEVSQLYDKFYRPDLIAKRLQGDEAPIQQALAEIGDVQTVLKGGLPPRLELISSEQRGLDLVLKYRVIDQGGGIGKLSYRINGVEQAATRQIHIGINGLEPIELTVPITQVRTIIAVEAGNKNNTVTSKPLLIEKNTNISTIKKPALYVLAVGVSEYKDRSMALNFADKDASAVSAALSSGGERLFNIKNSQIITLTNAEVTLDSVKQNFAQLAKQVQPEDVFILYLAGHGKVFDGSYHFIPSDAVYSSEKAFRTASLDENKLREMLASIKAQKSVIILDTCYAGKVAQASQANVKNLLVATRGGDSIDEKAAISRLMRATGRAILAASSDTQLALEGYNGHGYFTSALLEGLHGGADVDKNSLVNVLELGGFLSKRVPELTKDQQFPMMETEKLSDFPIGTTQ